MVHWPIMQCDPPSQHISNVRKWVIWIVATWEFKNGRIMLRAPTKIKLSHFNLNPNRWCHFNTPYVSKHHNRLLELKANMYTTSKDDLGHLTKYNAPQIWPFQDVTIFLEFFCWGLTIYTSKKINGMWTIKKSYMFNAMKLFIWKVDLIMEFI